MDYYRRYTGDYLKKTLELTMEQDGAYGRLLDAYYSKEAPLPANEVMRIARAMSSSERSAVRAVLAEYFALESDGCYHNARADEELGIALPKIEKLRQVARENGSKGGRPRKPKSVISQNQIGLSQETSSGNADKPEPVLKQNQPAHVTQPSAVSRQPEKHPSEQRFPGRDTTERAAPVIEPPGPEANVRAANDTAAGLLAAVCQRNEIQANAFHPLVVEWARDGFTVDQIKAAIATARHPQRKGDGYIPLAYLDPILRDVSKPKRSTWKSNDHDAEAMCRDLGIDGSRVGESREAWHQRIEAALAEQARQRVA
jgi:uncharacterized protein YdaU (DUF1376 family)